MPEILVIESDAETLSALVELLTDEGYAPVGVSWSDEAIAYLNAHPPPCMVLLDVAARDDASRFLRWVREQEELRHLHVAVISGWHSPERRLAEFRDHVARVIKKPFGIDEVVDAIAEHCGRSHKPRGDVSPS
jgi:DNA-binding response OmpR family regulator